MRKLLLLILIFSVCMMSCAQKNRSACDIMEKLLPACDGYLYISGAAETQKEYISAQELAFLYYGEKTELSELDRVHSYAVFISRDSSPCEVHIFKAKHQSDTDEIKAMLKSRGRLMCDPEYKIYEDNLFCSSKNDCLIFSRESYVFLICGNDAKALKKRAEELF